jgi:acylglycerol lipase
MASFSHFEWHSPDNLRLLGYDWRPDTKPKAVVCMIHGFADHMNRFAHVADAMVSKEYAYVGFDLRGHGKSDGKRGHTPDYDTLMKDIFTFVNIIREKYKNIPLFLYGHSMGGNLVLTYILRYHPEYFAGVIVTSPWLQLSFEPPAIKVAIGRLIGKIFPTFTEKSEIDAQGLSHDPEVGKNYKADPLVHNDISIAMFTGITNAGEAALIAAHRFHLPLLLMHGTSDPITSHRATKKFALQVKPNLLKFVEWKDMKHELHNETCKTEVIATITDWITERLKTVA